MEAALCANTPGAPGVVVLVDAPTSKARVPLALLDCVARAALGAKWGQTRVIIPCGPRLDLLSAVAGKVATALPGWSQYTVQVTAGDEQKARSKAAFLQLAVSPGAAGPVPYSVGALRFRSRRGEKTRLRCLSRDCPYRPREEVCALAGGAGGGPGDPLAEIDADDQEWLGVDEGLEEEGGDGDDSGAAGVVSPSRDCLRDLWPFAFGQDYYKALINLRKSDPK